MIPGGPVRGVGRGDGPDSIAGVHGWVHEALYDCVRFFWVQDPCSQQMAHIAGDSVDCALGGVKSNGGVGTGRIFAPEAFAESLAHACSVFPPEQHVGLALLSTERFE